MTSEQLWQATLGELELSISKVHFTTWLRNTFISEWRENVVIIGVPNNFTKAWLENKYHKEIARVLQNIIDVPMVDVSYRVESAKRQNSAPHEEEMQESVQTSDAVVTASMPTSTTAAHAATLNARYTFNTFVVGKGNELAYAAAVRVAKEPGKKYNPLFLYGGVGLGKTHLMQAVGIELLKTVANARVMYVSSEQFTNDYVGAVKSGAMEKFKGKYRTVDLLLVDDIQFIGGKEQTQEEFFHTFNAIRDAGKQIILTSDRPPKAIPALEERLISRFEWGMIVDIASPDLETRMAIVQAKSQERGIELSEDILKYLSTNVQSNVRELEGALNKLLAYCELNNVSPTIDVAKEIISSITMSQKRGGVSCRDLLKVVSEYFDITIEDLVGQSRRKELVGPRQISMFLMREELDASYPTIGHELGGRDHTTAMHAYSKIKRDSDNDERMRQDITFIKQRLYN